MQGTASQEVGMGKIEQLNLIAAFQQDNPSIKKPKTKRVHYDIPTYRKSYKNDVKDDGTIVDDVSTWGKMKEVYFTLTNFVGYNPFSTEEVQEIEGLRVWNIHYVPETYFYKTQLYKGQDFRVIETEIIGSEDLHITERLYLHESLLNALRSGVELSEAMTDIKLVLNLLKKGYTLDESKYVLETIRGKQNASNQKVNV